jgi:hypothetical protein
MASTIVLQQIEFNTLVLVNQMVTISHKLASDPDTSFVVDTTTQVVLPNGTLQPEYIISGLANTTNFTVRINNTCGGQVIAYRNLLTGVDPCPDIQQIFGTVS